MKKYIDYSVMITSILIFYVIRGNTKLVRKFAILTKKKKQLLGFLQKITRVFNI